MSKDLVFQWDGVKEEIRRSIMIKCEAPSFFPELFDNFGVYVDLTLQEISLIYNSWNIINIKGKKCSQCGKEKTLVREQEGIKICKGCFMKKWSAFTLTPLLLNKFVDYAKTKEYPVIGVHRGWYTGTIHLGVQIFKSYISKCEDRDYEILNLRERIAVLEKESKDNDFLIHKLKKKAKRLKWKISFPTFQRNVVYLGTLGMLRFKKIEEWNDIKKCNVAKYQCGISNPEQLRNHIWMKLKIGIYQDREIERTLDKKLFLKTYPKIVRTKKNEFFICYPARESVGLFDKKEDVDKFVREKKDVSFIVLSEGVKHPFRAVVFNKKGKILSVKSFGDGYLFDKGHIERELKSRVMKKLSERHKNSRLKKRRALKGFFSKIGNRHWRFVNSYNQWLSTEVVRFAKDFKNPILIWRKSQNLKRINYSGLLSRVLNSWSLEQQKSFLFYKCKLNNVLVYNVEYRDCNCVTCSKCSKVFKEDKVLTKKLGFLKRFKCESCGYDQDFLVNDSINLFHKFHDSFVSASDGGKGQAPLLSGMRRRSQKAVPT